MHPAAFTTLVGRVLVALQFGLIGILAVNAWSAHERRGEAAASLVGPAAEGLGLAAAAVLLGVWALSANRPGNFNITPEPRPGGELVRHGPYRWVRHPMYGAVLLAAAGAARFADDGQSWIVMAALAAVLAVKASLEERALLRRHAQYQAYRHRTARFVPWLY
jgi:protein-S-isoprenylcysteine O-methyltransferase Ste14